MNKITNLIAIGIGALIVAVTIIVLAVFKPGIKQDVPIILPEETTTVAVEETPTIMEETTTVAVEDVPPLTVADTVPSTETHLEYADRVASENIEEFVLSTAVNGTAYYKFDTSVLGDASWLPNMEVFKILMEDDEYVYGLEPSNFVIHEETYTFDGEVASVDFTVTLPSGYVGRYTLCVDIPHRTIYSNY